MIKRIAALACGLLVVLFLLAHAGSFLVVNNPAPSDLILVLQGAPDDTPYLRAVELVRQGYAPRIMLNADSTREKFGKSDFDLATAYVRGATEGSPALCPIREEYLYGEAKAVQRCLAQSGVKSVLIVTSDFHTRLAQSVFRTRLPQYQWSVAAASAPFHFATDWWKHRRWAKTVFQCWTELAWWVLVDRWSGIASPNPNGDPNADRR